MKPNELLMRHAQAMQAGDFVAALDVLRQIVAANNNVGFQALSLEEMLAPIEKPNYVIEALDIGPGRPTQIAGMGGSGKSITEQAAIISTIIGRRVWGEFWTRQGPCAHLDYEMGRRATLLRYHRLCAGMGVSWEHEVAPHLKLYPLPSVYLNTAGVEEHLKRVADGKTVVQLDSLRRALPGEDENDSAITEYIDVMTRVSEVTGATFKFLHHSTTKGGGKGQDARAAGRGSSAIYDSSGPVFVLTGKKSEPVKVEHTKPGESGDCAGDFYLVIQDVELDGNPKAGVKVEHRTVQEVEAGKGGDEVELERDIGRVLDAVRRAGGNGVSGIVGIVDVANIGRAARRAARTAITRGLLVNVATKKNGDVDEVRPRYVVA
jgi:hypothetical protein